MKIIKTAFVFLERDGQVLLIQEVEGQAKGLWSLPGGHIEPNETPEAGARREAKEEAGYEVHIERELLVKNLTGVSYMGDPEENNDTIEMHVFLAKILAGDIAQRVEKVTARWVSKEEARGLPLRWQWLAELFT